MTPWTVAHQAPLSKGFFRQEYWSELPFPPPGDRPHPGIKLESAASPVLEVAESLSVEPWGRPIIHALESWQFIWGNKMYMKSKIAQRL